MTKLSRRSRLAIVALAGLVALIGFQNYAENLNWFGGYDWYAMLAGLFLLLAAVVLVAPGEKRPGPKSESK
jgi:hypothetical protein